MKTFVALLLLGVLVHCSSSMPTKHYKQADIDEVLAKVPPEEQQNFIKYHLQIGYDLQQKVDQWPESITSEFAAALYHIAQEKHQITEPGQLKAARNVICFPGGPCIDLGDIGVHP